MLDQLHALLVGPLRDMLADPLHPWRTVDVTYEDPHVERVWTQWGKSRVSLHRIHPCRIPLFHPHPWPSAMIICSGVYLMGVGRSLTGQAPVETVKIKLTSGAQYEMLDPYGWHWVQPLGAPVMSVMLTGEPWQMPENFPKHGKGVEHEDLAPEVRDEILQWFRADMGIVPGGHG